MKSEAAGKLFAFMKKEAVLLIAAVCAIASMAAVPPSLEYIDYLDGHVLGLLFCLMAVVAGFTQLGLFRRLSRIMTYKVSGVRLVSGVLVALCFFSSMFITNDVALLTFVPLTISILQQASPKQVIPVVVLQTIAANLGSMMTPVGNPQNLFLYAQYEMGLGEFFSAMAPLGVISLILLTVGVFFLKDHSMTVRFPGEETPVCKWRAVLYTVLFVCCLLTVFRMLDVLWLTLLVIVAMLISNWKILLRVDYSLLLTFVCFFVFVGNIRQVPAVQEGVSWLLNGREVIASVLVSQVISNVPAAVMLSSFTEKGRALLLGTNIGGLGTLIASLASLISFRLYSRMPGAKGGKYLLQFTLYNLGFLVVLLLFCWVTGSLS